MTGTVPCSSQPKQKAFNWVEKDIKLFLHWGVSHWKKAGQTEWGIQNWTVPLHHLLSFWWHPLICVLKHRLKKGRILKEGKMHFPFAGKTTYCLAHKPQERFFKIKNKTKTETKTHWEKSSGCCVNCNRIFHRYLYFRIMENLGKL